MIMCKHALRSAALNGSTIDHGRGMAEQDRVKLMDSRGRQ